MSLCLTEQAGKVIFLPGKSHQAPHRQWTMIALNEDLLHRESQANFKPIFDLKASGRNSVIHDVIHMTGDNFVT